MARQPGAAAAAPRESADRPSPGSLNYSIELRAVITRAIQVSGLGRPEIAARMSDALGVPVTKAQLDAFTSPKRSRWRFPMEYAAAFEAAVGSNCLQELLARKRGTRVLSASEAVDAEIGKLDRAERQIRERRLALIAEREGIL